MQTVFRVRELRQRADMTQGQLAEKLGFKSPSTITMWESGDRNPPSTMLPRLADVLHCTIDELFGRGTGADST